MKKYYNYILSALLLMGLFSCGENEDFSKLHVLTPEEEAEIRRQDSILEAQKTNINANLILKYEAQITISSTLYQGVAVPIEINKIAELFGLTEEEVLLGISGESGAPEIKGFAIEWTTRADVGTATNTNSPWGHWWAADGTTTKWGETAACFAEFDPEIKAFNVGQYPGRLVAGDTIKFIEALKYNEKRLAVVITVIPQAAGQVTAKVVSTQDITVEQTPKSSYDADSVQFDLNKVLSDLGVSSMDEVKFVGLNEDGTYNQETVTGKGFWYDLNGFVGSWGDNASVFTNYGDFGANYISVGQFPDRMTEGQSVQIKYGFMANNKIVLLNITVKILGFQDPETAPTGNPIATSINVELSKAYSEDYATVTFDVKETLRNAFKMTTYQIHKAIASGELKLYQGEVTEAAPTYTADVPGYWLKADGTPGAWAESLAWCSLGHTETTLFLVGGNHPGNGVAGSTVTSKLIATCNGGSVTINLTFKIN
jgi:hypothetical protein